MSTYNICFGREIRNIIILISPLIWSYVKKEKAQVSLRTNAVHQSICCFVCKNSITLKSMLYLLTMEFSS